MRRTDPLVLHGQVPGVGIEGMRHGTLRFFQIILKYISHKFLHLSHFYEHSSVALSTSTLYNLYHHPAPELSHLPKPRLSAPKRPGRAGMPPSPRGRPHPGRVGKARGTPQVEAERWRGGGAVTIVQQQTGVSSGRQPKGFLESQKSSVSRSPELSIPV